MAPAPELRRTLGLGDAVTIGLGAMVGAGIFSAFGPAARAAGSGILIGLALAAVVAYCNAYSSARLAARYPASGGTYVYGRERLGEFWGYLAGWTFIIGKTASCAAMALTVGLYVWPEQARLVAIAAVVVLTAVNYRGIQKSAWVVRIILAVVVAVLLVLSLASFTSAPPTADASGSVDVGALGILQSAGLLFFAFAGYARMATLGEEVRDPARTIPRAILIALAVAVALYALVAAALLTLLGPGGMASSDSPLATAAVATGLPWLPPIVRVTAALAALGALMALILGISRTTLAMARDRHLPHGLAAVHPRFPVPHRAEVAVGIAVATLVMFLDLGAAIGFSSFGVLLYYAIANASAWTLEGPGRGVRRATAAIGLAGCLVLAFTLPITSVVAGAALTLAGAVVFAARRRPASAR